MKIETYEVEEINASEASQMAADGMAMELVEKLGLEGQRKLCNTETGTRLPYRRMTSLEMIVFQIHCPINTKLEEYQSSIIPVRVLQVAAFCKEGGFFPRIEVWHPQDAKLDPVLVGRTKANTWEGELFLLARWGEVWKNFEQLVAEARDIWITKRKAQFAKARADLASDEAQLNEVAAEVFLTGKMQTVSYCGW